MKEQWKPVRGFEDYAEISNMGQIHKFERVYYRGKNHKQKCIQEEELTYGSPCRGYLQASFGSVSKGVHVWVYLTFVGDIPEGLEVNHIDENKHNNCIWNLNLLSHGDNVRYGTGIERSAAAHRGRKRPAEVVAKIAAAKRGKYNTKKSKAVQALNPKTLEVVYEFPSAHEAQRQYGFDASTISKCCLGKIKKYKGYIWQFYSEK